ncbi:glycoside hydrolase family 32 protein [bacterium]|nr:glycoside hydrolase family 32 protein [bacterium]
MGVPRPDPVPGKETEDSQGLAAIEQADEIRDADGLYKESRRPQLYFSPRRGGCGDANGLVYHEGEYHLFFQHNPFNFDGGRNSHWGHAVSKDLVHWEEMPDALLPDDFGLQYSGSGLVDTDNSAGLQTGTEKTLALIYTAAARADGPMQCLAYSHDRGRTWTKFSGTGEEMDHGPLFWSRLPPKRGQTDHESQLRLILLQGPQIMGTDEQPLHRQHLRLPGVFRDRVGRGQEAHEMGFLDRGRLLSGGHL